MHIKMRQGRFVSAWVALTLQFSSVSVSSRSQPRAPGILPSPMPFGSRDFVEALVYLLKSPYSLLLLGASIWPLHGHHLSLKPGCIFSVPSSHPLQSLFFLKTGCHKWLFPDWGRAPAHGKIQGMLSYP